MCDTWCVYNQSLTSTTAQTHHLHPVLSGLSEWDAQLSAWNENYNVRTQWVSFIPHGIFFVLELILLDLRPHRILIPFLGRSERASHECSVIFFTPGRFKADIQCSAQNSQMVSISSHAAESTSSAGAGSSVGAHTVNTTGSLSGHRSSSDAHIWRFTPPIEVTVVEWFFGYTHPSNNTSNTMFIFVMWMRKK